MSQKTLLLLLYSIIGGFGVYNVLIYTPGGNLTIFIGMLIYFGLTILSIILVNKRDTRYLETKYPSTGMVIYDHPPHTPYTTQYKILYIDHIKRTMTVRIIGGYLPTLTNPTDPDYLDNLEETFSLGGHTWYYIPANQPTN